MFLKPIQRIASREAYHISVASDFRHNGRAGDEWDFFVAAYNRPLAGKGVGSLDAPIQKNIGELRCCSESFEDCVDGFPERVGKSPPIYDFFTDTDGAPLALPRLRGFRDTAKPFLACSSGKLL